MSVEVADVADALVAFLEGETFSAPYAQIRPERLYDPDFKIDQLSSLKVSVIGVDVEGDVVDRDDDQEDVSVAVCVQKYTNKSRPDMDALQKLACEVRRRCLRASFANLGVYAVKAVFDPLYHVGKYRQDGVFWSGILVTFRLMNEAEEED